MIPTKKLLADDLRRVADELERVDLAEVELRLASIAATPSHTWPPWMGASPRAGAPWTPEEEERLKIAWESGTALRVITERHGRKVGGITAALGRIYGWDKMWEVRPPHPDDVREELAYLRVEVGRLRKLVDRAYPNNKYKGDRR